MNNERPSFKAGVDAQTLAKHLDGIAVGGVATYEALSKIVGSDVQADRGSLETARRVLLRENQIVFGAVHGVGLKRLNPAEIVEQGQDSVTKIRRASKRAMKRLATADFETLPVAEQGKHRMASATLGAIALCTGTKAQHKLEQRVQGNGNLDVGEAMKLFAVAT